MPKRPHPQPLEESSSSQLVHHVRTHELYPLFSQLSFHVIPAKIDEDLGTIYASIDELGGTCIGIAEAQFIITALKGRPRLLRTIGKEWIDAKPILMVDYVHDTFTACLAAAQEGSIPHLPPRKKYLAVAPRPKSNTGRKRSPIIIESDDDIVVPEPKRRRTGSPNWIGETCDLPDMTLLDSDCRLEDIPKRCIERACPLVCINQDLINAIKPIYEDREFEELDQKNSNVLSYRRSMSILKSVPRKIRSGKEARKLIDVGEKVAMRIDEFLATGRVEESEDILKSDRYRLLKLFASVYSIGHHTARDLYDKYGCRSLDDLLFHYRDKAGEELPMKEVLRRRRTGGMTHVDIVEQWISIKDELDSKITREEVREIAECVMEHLEAFLDGCEHTLTGGYRRGKPESNDVDVVFCPPEDDQDIGLLKKLYLRLSDLGIITHVLRMYHEALLTLDVTHREAETPIKASPANFDNLDKAFVIFKLPGKGRLHRRVDLISSPRNRYAAAVLSWSGSMMFERDLKRHAEDRGVKFRAGLLNPVTGEEVFIPTERGIFAYLGLRYVPPELRNADG